jgi:hypothetical protein
MKKLTYAIVVALMCVALNACQASVEKILDKNPSDLTSDDVAVLIEELDNFNDDIEVYSKNNDAKGLAKYMDDMEPKKFIEIYAIGTYLTEGDVPKEAKKNVENYDTVLTQYQENIEAIAMIDALDLTLN